MNDPQIIAIAALGKNTRNICHDDELLWRIPEDLKRVKEHTFGYPLIMGRKTFESIGKPLPGRTNIVLTRDLAYKTQDGVKIVHSVEDAMKVAKDSPGGQDRFFIFGGAEIYTLFLPHTNKLMLTLVDDDKPGTAQFPPYEKDFKIIQREDGGNYFDKETNKSSIFEWVNLERL